MSRFSLAAALLLTTSTFSFPVLAQDSWTDRLSLNADVRLRYEGIDEDFEEERNRSRYRVRLNLAADVYDDVQLIFQLASGGSSPVSRNVTFGDGFATDDFGFSRAYVDWQINGNVSFYGGKMKNPLYRAGGAQMLYDNDLNPEGFSLAFDNGSFFGSANVFLVQERSSADDSHLYAAQAGMNFDVADGAKLTAGVGYLAYTNTIGNFPFFNARPQGNTVDTSINYVFDYKNIEVFGAYNMKLADMPFEVFAQYTQNNEVSDEDTAYAFGANLGKAKTQGTWQAQYLYMDVEADAVIGTFNDSNFGGGETDSSGHIFRGKYMVRDQIAIGGSLFINEVDEFVGNEHDYTRFQLDVEFKFK